MCQNPAFSSPAAALAPSSANVAPPTFAPQQAPPGTGMCQNPACDQPMRGPPLRSLDCPRAGSAPPAPHRLQQAPPVCRSQNPACASPALLPPAPTLQVPPAASPVEAVPSKAGFAPPAFAPGPRRMYHCRPPLPALPPFQRCPVPDPACGRFVPGPRRLYHSGPRPAPAPCCSSRRGQPSASELPAMFGPLVSGCNGASYRG